jgi:hypothetical protein
MKPVPKPTISTILAGIQAAARQQKTNPYQISKASGIPLTTVHRLLGLKINIPLRNVEMLAKALGLTITIVTTGKGIVSAATGRKHGKRKAKAA